MSLLNSLFGNANSQAAQQNAGQASAQAQQLAASQQMQGMAGQMQANQGNGLGQIVTYQGQAPQYVQQQQGLNGWMVPSVYVPQGTAYQANGGVIINPADVSADVIDEVNRKFKLELTERFLAFPVHQREAFLITLRARAVEEGMNAQNQFFGVNRYGATPTPPCLTLQEYEDAHASSLFDAILEDE